MAQVIVSRLVATDFVAVVRCDVAVEQGGSGREQRSWGLDCSAVDRPGRECRRLGAVVRCFVAGSRVVVAVVNDVGGSDGGCAAVVTDDVATLGELVGLVTKALGSSVVWVNASVVSVVVSVLKSALGAVFAVWEAVSSIVGAT